MDVDFRVTLDIIIALVKRGVELLGNIAGVGRKVTIIDQGEGKEGVTLTIELWMENGVLEGKNIILILVVEVDRGRGGESFYFI